MKSSEIASAIAFIETKSDDPTREELIDQLKQNNIEKSMLNILFLDSLNDEDYVTIIEADCYDDEPRSEIYDYFVTKMSQTMYDKLCAIAKITEPERDSHLMFFRLYSDLNTHNKSIVLDFKAFIDVVWEIIGENIPVKSDSIVECFELALMKNPGDKFYEKAKKNVFAGLMHNIEMRYEFR